MARAVILLLDSFGIGGAPDAAKFGDTGADTLGHIARECLAAGRPLKLPNMAAIGLEAAAAASRGAKLPASLGTGEIAINGAYGYASPVSHGKDTLSGHWEMTGVPVTFDWGYFPEKEKCFPKELVEELVGVCGLPGVLGEKHASGTEIIKELGLEHMKSGKPIIYTSADSVFQIAAHEESFGLEKLYVVCQKAFALVQKYRIARVIARPFVGNTSEDFNRTANRHDYAVPAPDKTLLDFICEKGGAVTAVGKISDIFAGRGVTSSYKGKDTAELMDRTLAGFAELPQGGLLFTNFVDFDSKYGHRRDIFGYADALEYVDRRLSEIKALLRPGDLVVLTADHGCDPVWIGSDHTRENIPLLFFGPASPDCCLGHRETFADIGQTLAKHLGLSPMKHGTACF